jgi:hypothetical protein
MERSEQKPRKLTREQKVINALSSFEQEGVLYASPNKILERVQELYPSRLNVPFLPLWDRALDNLKRNEQVVEHPHGDIELTLG